TRCTPRPCWVARRTHLRPATERQRELLSRSGGRPPSRAWHAKVRDGASSWTSPKTRRPFRLPGHGVIAGPIHTAEIALRDLDRRFRAESDLSRPSATHPRAGARQIPRETRDLNENAPNPSGLGAGKRWEGDSNPRGADAPTGFQDRRLQPLRHPTVGPALGPRCRGCQPPPPPPPPPPPHPPPPPLPRPVPPPRPPPPTPPPPPRAPPP